MRALFLLATLAFLWDANNDGITIGYQLRYGLASDQKTTVQVAGDVTSYTVNGLTPGVRYYFVVEAYAADGRVSPPSNEISGVAPGCGALQIAVKAPPAGWSSHVTIGDMGFVYFALSNPQPIVDLQVRFGSQVIGHQSAHAPGDDLRATLGLSFSVPRIAGDYPMTVWAKDTTGCESTTTVQRIITVQEP